VWSAQACFSAYQPIGRPKTMMAASEVTEAQTAPPVVAAAPGDGTRPFSARHANTN